MKRLLLLRHAKSEHGDVGMDDFDRGLNDRGRRDAVTMGERIAGAGLTPELVLCSSAVRARQTIERFAPAAGIDASAIRYDENLYLASAQTLVDAAMSGGGEAASVMVVAHNPGLEQLVSSLAGSLQPFPTAAIAVCELRATSWGDILDSAPVSVDVHRPKDG